MQDGLEEAGVEARDFGMEAEVSGKGRGGDRKGEACPGDRRKVSLRPVVRCLDVRAAGYREAGSVIPQARPLKLCLPVCSARRTK